MLDPITKARAEEIFEALIKYIQAEAYDRMICHGESFEEAIYQLSINIMKDN